MFVIKLHFQSVAEGLLVRDSPLVESLCCVLEKDTLSTAYIVLVQTRKTEKLLTGM